MTTTLAIPQVLTVNSERTQQDDTWKKMTKRFFVTSVTCNYRRVLTQYVNIAVLLLLTTDQQQEQGKVQLELLSNLIIVAVVT